jgi:hypothetical protein
MNMQLAVYSVCTLFLRWIFYIPPGKKTILLYTLKAAIEIGVFLLLFRSRLPVTVAFSGLLVLLNLLCYVVEVKVTSADGTESRLQNLELLIGFALYAAALIIIFRSGNIIGFNRAVTDWATDRGIIATPRFYYLIAFGFLAITEPEYIARYFRMRFAEEHENPVSFNGAYQTLGYAERAAVVVLVLSSQYAAAAIIIAGRIVSSGLGAGRKTELALAMLSLAWALMVSLAVKSAL